MKVFIFLDCNTIPILMPPALPILNWGPEKGGPGAPPGAGLRVRQIGTWMYLAPCTPEQKCRIFLDLGPPPPDAVLVPHVGSGWATSMEGAFFFKQTITKKKQTKKMQKIITYN